MIEELDLIQPVLGNTCQEAMDYIYSFDALHYLHSINVTKQIPPDGNFVLTKKLIDRNWHYLANFITDPAEMAKKQAAEANLDSTLGLLRSLSLRLFHSDRQAAQIVDQYIDGGGRMLEILRKNFTYNDSQVDSLIEQGNGLIKKYSKQIKLN